MKAKKVKPPKQITRSELYRRLFHSDDGKLVLNDLMNTHFVLRPTHTPENVQEAVHREGQRDVVLRILKILQTTPEKLRERLEEGQGERDEF